MFTIKLERNVRAHLPAFMLGNSFLSLQTIIMRNINMKFEKGRKKKHIMFLGRKFTHIRSSQIHVRVHQIFNQNSDRIYLGVRGESGVGR